MTTLAQIQQAMGPVYLAWATPATDHHFIQPDAIATAWQPVQKAEKPKKVSPAKSRTQAIIGYLSEHGAVPGGQLIQALGVNKAQLRLAHNAKTDNLRCESIGYGADKATLYWVDSKPPDISLRCVTYKVWDFFRRNPWQEVADIPTDLVAHKAAHSYAADLQRQGRLTFRLKKREGRMVKHYKAVL